MPLVEIVPAISTDLELGSKLKQLMLDWGKAPAIAMDTPGFIVNRVARPFYGEAIRIYEEGIADIPTIDWALKEIGGFRMGPFELMDYIGNDVNYTVTETVFTSFYFDQRYKPSFTQKRMMVTINDTSLTPVVDPTYAIAPAANNVDEGSALVFNVTTVNVADATTLYIATKEDIDLAMTKGVNYPKGLLAWADELGLLHILNILEDLYEEYGEDRYRPCVLLKRMVAKNERFYV